MDRLRHANDIVGADDYLVKSLSLRRHNNQAYRWLVQSDAQYVAIRHYPDA